MKSQQQSRKTTQQFFRSYGIDPLYGTLIPQNYNPRCFNKSQIMEVLLNLHINIKNKEVEVAIKKMGKIQIDLDNNLIDDFTKKRDCVCLHGFLSDILHAFTYEKRSQGFSDTEMIVPSNLAQPLQIICKRLGMKYGMCGQFYCNWKFKDERTNFPEQIQLKDLTRVFFFNQPQVQYYEDMFFCSSTIGSIYLFKSINALHILTQVITRQPLKARQYAIQVLGKVCTYIKKLNDVTVFLLTNFDGDFFTNKLRNFLSGFKDLQVEGSQQRMTSGGGAGGFDPCFQLFQRILSIKYQGKLAQAQQLFKTGFPDEIKNLINYYEQTQILKQYFQQNNLKEEYNKVLKEYSMFYVVHRQILYKFVAQDLAAETGKGGVQLPDIINRDKAIVNLAIQ